MDSIYRFLSAVVHPNRLMNILIFTSLMGLATIISFGFFHTLESPSANIALTYIMAIFLVARLTSGYLYGFFACLVGVVCINFLFTYPFFALNFTLTGYPITFIAMFTITVATSAITTNMKEQAKIISEREKMLMEAEKEKMRANLLRAISHDIRTPLTSIIGSSNVYLENEAMMTDANKREMVEHISEDAHWLLNMVENLLSVTRINADGSTKVNTSLEPVEEVLAEAVNRLRKRLPRAQINVQVPDDFLMIPMDAVLIEQVLINLMENAIVHSKSRKPVDCYVDTTDRDVVFHVKDYGVSIPEDKLPTIFDGSSSTPSTSADGRKGMGIGLSICKTIIRAHGGNISAFNHEEGAEFYFTLPKEETESDT